MMSQKHYLLIFLPNPATFSEITKSLLVYLCKVKHCKMRKEFNGETWMLIILIILSSCSYWYLYENKPYSNQTYLNNNLELPLKVEEKDNKIANSVDFIDQKIIKKSIEIIKEWLPVN